MTAYSESTSRNHSVGTRHILIYEFTLMYATHNVFQCVTLILGRYLITSFLRAIERGHPEATAPGYLLCLPVDDTSHDIISKLELLSKIENSRHPYDDTCCGRLCNCCGNDGMCQGKMGQIFYVRASM